jgi:hypothetical protein
VKLNREGNYLFIGTYDLGDEVVGLVGELGTSNGHIFIPTASQTKAQHSNCNGLPHITVGMSQGRWARALEVLLHEAFEYAMMRMSLRFACSDNWSRSHADYVFLMTHEQMSEGMSRIAPFLASAQPDLSRVYRFVSNKKNKIKPL